MIQKSFENDQSNIKQEIENEVWLNVALTITDFKIIDSILEF